MAKSIWVELLGAEVRILEGKKYRTRIVEAGKEHPQAVLMVHGGGGHIESFARNIVPLGKHFHAIGMEMLWHGFSDAPPIENSEIQVGEQIIDVIDALGKDKI